MPLTPTGQWMNLTNGSSTADEPICGERNWLYQCGVQQICLQLDEQSNSFPNSIVTAIVYSDAYDHAVSTDG